jgi:hypothetical protein
MRFKDLLKISSYVFALDPVGILSLMNKMTLSELFGLVTRLIPLLSSAVAAIAAVVRSYLGCDL